MKKSISERWQKVENKLPQSYKDWFAKEKEYVVEYLNSDTKVLDFGCGYGGRAIYYVQKKTKWITGVDIDPLAIKNVKTIFPYPFFVNERDKIPFKKYSFDLILMLGNTFGNLSENKEKILKESMRVLFRNGKVIISVFNENALDERMKVYKLGGGKINKILPDGTIFFDDGIGADFSEQFSKEKLETIILKSGFFIEKITKTDIAYLCTIIKK